VVVVLVVLAGTVAPAAAQGPADGGDPVALLGGEHLVAIVDTGSALEVVTFSNPGGVEGFELAEVGDAFSPMSVAGTDLDGTVPEGTVLAVEEEIVWELDFEDLSDGSGSVAVAVDGEAALAEGGADLDSLSDPWRTSQWQLDTVRADQVRGSNAAGAVVAVLDTGVNPGHPDLAGLVLSGRNFVNTSSTSNDWHGHGTFVTGMVTANTGNGIGIAATVDDVRILPGTVCDAAGICHSAAVAQGIIWATDQGADVINLSLGGGRSTVVQSAVRYALDNDVVVVASAGNSGHLDNPPNYPAAYEGVIGVAATKRDDSAAHFSSYGDWVDLAAPGDSVLSTTAAGGYGAGSGTSFSAPMVAGGAALVRGLDPDLTRQEVADLLRRSARDVSTPGWDARTGHGVLNLPALVDLAAPAKVPQPGAPAPPTSTTTPPPSSPTVVHRPGVVGPNGPVTIDLATGNPVPLVTGAPHPHRLVAVSEMNDRSGTWAADPEGRMFVSGSVRSHGGLGHLRLNQPVLGMTPTADGRGYWMVAADGGIFAFGNAAFHGSMGGARLNRPITGMTVTPSGRGYVLVASDGGVFTFGDAKFYGSTGSLRLNRPVNGIAMTPSGRGYWMVASDGGIFSFGDATFHGSLGARHLDHPVVGMIASPSGAGYWLIDAAGRSYSFGDVR
jgi:subtilisin family serine protease